MACAPALREGSPPEKVPYREKIGPYLVKKEFDEEGAVDIVCAIDIDVVIECDPSTVSWGRPEIVVECGDAGIYTYDLIDGVGKQYLKDRIHFAEPVEVYEVRLRSTGGEHPFEIAKLATVPYPVDAGQSYVIRFQEDAADLELGLIDETNFYLFYAHFEKETITGVQAYHFGARMYDPVVAVWLSPDPADEFWNSYSYVGGNPLNLVDPTGMQSEDPCGSGASGVGCDSRVAWCANNAEDCENDDDFWDDPDNRLRVAVYDGYVDAGLDWSEAHDIIERLSDPQLLAMATSSYASINTKFVNGFPIGKSDNADFNNYVTTVRLAGMALGGRTSSVGEDTQLASNSIVDVGKAIWNATPLALLTDPSARQDVTNFLMSDDAAVLAMIPPLGAASRLGTAVANPGMKITGFTAHGINQAITRGVGPKALLNTVRSAKVVFQQGGGKYLFLSDDAAVVLNKAGKVVTTYGADMFDATIKAVLGH